MSSKGKEKGKGKGIISGEENIMVSFLKERNLDHVNLISELPSPKRSFYSEYGKRVLDICISLPIVVLTAPLNLVFAICTFFDVGRPIIYNQTRTGKNLLPFRLSKFRNMNEKKDKDGNLLPPDERVTKFGLFMRRTSLDELLNFWSVLKGDMSIIGPRPLPQFFTDRMSERHKMRYAVRPGLECPRVIDMSEEEYGYYQLQYENDIWYVEHISFLTDLKMVFSLFKMVLDVRERGKHANTGTYFVGYNDEGIALSLRLAKEQYPEVLPDSGSHID